VTNPSTGMIQESREVYNAAGQRVSSEITIKQPTASGMERIVSKTWGVGGMTQTAQAFYWDNPADGKKYNNLKAAVNPDGSWIVFDYDIQGRCILEVRPVGDLTWDTVKNMVPSDAAALGRATCYDYTSLESNSDTVTADDSRPRTITEKAQGIVTGITYHVYKTVGGETVEITEQAAAQGAAYGATGNLRTTTVYYASTAGKVAAGKLKSVTQPDGKVTSYTYELGDFLRGDDFGAAVFTPSASGACLRTTVQTTPLVACKSTRSITVSGMGGKTVHEETQVLTAGGTWERLSWTGYQLNLRGQVTATVSSDGSRTDTTWGCCNKESETDATGIQTFYFYDALKRLDHETCKVESVCNS
jgi:hypothetical protein